MRRAIATVVVALILPACSSGSPPPSPAGSAETVSPPAVDSETISEAQPAQVKERERQPKPPTNLGGAPKRPTPRQGGDRKPDPVYEDGIPQVKVSPSRGRVGSRVRIEGHGFTDEQWRSDDSSLWLVGGGSGTCLLYASAEHSVRVSHDGHLTGEFTVPAVGDCKQEGRQDAVSPGRYTIAYQCTVCIIGRFEVTPS